MLRDKNTFALSRGNVCQKASILLFVFFVILLLLPKPLLHAQQKTKPRIIVSTDIGGDDPDDYQSLVHLLVYADRFSIEGLISSPPGRGRKKHIEEVLDAYAIDFPKLQRKAKGFPSPKALFAVTHQGATDPQSDSLPGPPSDGAKWIISKAMEKKHNPLYILVWGSITDVAQAVHSSPEIKKNIRIYSIGSWNTLQDKKSRDYLYRHHPDLWWIENNTTFRGMYMGGYQDEDYSNTTFVEQHVKGHGALGELFWQKKKDIKMGDTPSVLYFLHGNIEQPEAQSWGGSFVKGDRPHYWSDNPDPELAENGRAGARSVNTFRKQFLEDWKIRMNWLR